MPQRGALDTGPYLSFPRYVANFPELDLNKNGRYSAVFRGFPGSPASLSMHVVGRTGKDHEWLAWFTPDVTMELVSEDGKQICKVGGKLNHWSLTYSNDTADYRHGNCDSVKIRRNRFYTLKIRVAGAKEELGRITYGSCPPRRRHSRFCYLPGLLDIDRGNITRGPLSEFFSAFSACILCSSPGCTFQC
jgi:hypothetical protein